jgi:hypothetical protein
VTKTYRRLKRGEPDENNEGKREERNLQINKEKKTDKITVQRSETRKNEIRMK